MNLYKYLAPTIARHHILPEFASKEIFLSAVNDFVENKIDAHAMSTISTQLYFKLNKPLEIESNYERAFARLLAQTVELDHYRRNNMPMYRKVVEALKNFLDQNK